MKKSTIIVLVSILLIAFGIQTYLMYQLHQQVSQISSSQSKDYIHLSPMPLDDEFMNNDAWNPYQEMQRMQNEMSQLFGNSMSRFHLNSKDSLTKMPAFDLKEEADRYIVTLDIPGGNPSSLDVKLEGQVLSIVIKTEHANEQDDGENKYHRQERFSGIYQRSITLPGAVNESAMSNGYKNGVLTIIIPKAS